MSSSKRSNPHSETEHGQSHVGAIVAKKLLSIAFQRIKNEVKLSDR